MKKLKSLLILIILISILSSCNKKGPVIGFMLPHMTIKRYPVERDEFTRRVKELGGDVVFMSADNDEIKQNQQVRDILKDIDVLVLDPVNRFQAAGMVRAAHEKGIPVISYDRLVANCDVDAFLSFDASAIGTKMADYTLKLVPSGKYVILDGDKSDINAVLIHDAIEKAIAPSVNAGKIKVVYSSFIELYSADDAERQSDKYMDLMTDKPDAILCAADMIAKGAIQSLKDHQINKSVKVTGQGAESFACREILSGNQSMTIYKPVKKLASLAADIAVDMSKGKKTRDIFKQSINNGQTDVPSTFLDVVVVDSSNLKSTVIADGMISEQDLK